MTTQASDAASTTAGSEAVAESGQGRTATVTLPFVSRQVRVPRVRPSHLPTPHLPTPHLPTPHLPTPRLSALPTPRLPARRLPTPHLPALPRMGRREVSDAARGVASLLPPRRELVYYTGLGALAVGGVLEWPVAVAVAAGTAVARKSARAERRDERRAEPARQQRERAASEKPASEKAESDDGARKAQQNT
jgi:hypothetical protein